jgi:hypothetical protein
VWAKRVLVLDGVRVRHHPDLVESGPGLRKRFAPGWTTIEVLLPPSNEGIIMGTGRLLRSIIEGDVIIGSSAFIILVYDMGKKNEDGKSGVKTKRRRRRRRRRRRKQKAR